MISNGQEMVERRVGTVLGWYKDGKLNVRAKVIRVGGRSSGSVV